MHGNNKKDISNEIMNYKYVTLMSSKMRIGIIGGGKAGEIKTKHFADGKCYVEVLSKTFSNTIKELNNKFPNNVKLVNEEFSYEFLKDKHLIIIAIDDNNLRGKIILYCNENYKIYVDCTDFREGNSVVPVQIDTDNMCAALNTKSANPRGTVLVSKKVNEVLESYNDFIGHTSKIRNKAKNIPEYKSEILKFIGTENYKDIYDNGVYKESFYNNFPKSVVDYLFE